MKTVGHGYSKCCEKFIPADVRSETTSGRHRAAGITRLRGIRGIVMWATSRRLVARTATRPVRESRIAESIEVDFEDCVRLVQPGANAEAVYWAERRKAGWHRAIKRVTSKWPFGHSD